MIQGPTPIVRCLILLAVINMGFGVHSLVHLEPATIALLGASLSMVISRARQKPEDNED